MSEPVKINLIDEPKKRIRESIDLGGVQELAESIREVGLINAINIKKVKKRFEIIAGHRRYLACKMLGLKQIEANIEKKTEEEGEEIKIAENIIREDLNPIDIANALLYMENKLKMTAEKIAKKQGKTKNWVEKKIALLKLPVDCINSIKDKLISEKVGIELGKIDEAIERKRLLSYAIAHGATWKVVNEWVINYKMNRGVEEQIINKELGQAETQGQTTVKVKCMLCGKEGDITEMRYEPCHSECYVDLMHEIQKRGK